MNDFTFHSAGAELSGTLALPASGGPHPGLLLLVGSGPVDRDSNMKRMPLGVTAQLSAALQGAGVATLRYDKRGVGASGGDYLSAGLRDEIEDARAALDALRRHPAIDGDRVAVIGHSIGAVIAASLAVDEPVVGVGLLSGTVMTGQDVLEFQADVAMDVLPRPVQAVLRLFRVDVRKVQAKRIGKLRRTTTDVARMQGVRINARWLREFLDHDPSVDLARISVPVLAVTGAKDVQVPASDVERMGAMVKGPFQGEVLDGRSHIFRADPDDVGVRGYRRSLAEPVAPELLELVIDWATRVLATDGARRMDLK